MSGPDTVSLKRDKTNGLIVGLTMVITALILDAIINVPFVIIPHGGSYLEFFTSVMLWDIVIKYIVIIFLYWRIKVKPFLHNQ